MTNTNTKIQWTETTWNPLAGCTKVSLGCKNCYAATIHNKRHQAFEKYGGIMKDGRKMPEVYRRSFDVIQLLPERLSQPLHWKKPRRVFVNSMSDLFHPKVPFEYIDRVWRAMEQTPQHTYQILTKRPKRMATYTQQRASDPLPNVWLGTSIEDTRVASRADELREADARILFLSCEPIIGPLDGVSLDGIGWVIAGGESGDEARKMDFDWICRLRDACIEKEIPFFVKQLGTWWAKNQRATDRQGGNLEEFPPSLRVRQYPPVITTHYANGPPQVQLDRFELDEVQA